VTCTAEQKRIAAGLRERGEHPAADLIEGLLAGFTREGRACRERRARGLRARRDSDGDGEGEAARAAPGGNVVSEWRAVLESVERGERSVRVLAREEVNGWPTYATNVNYETDDGWRISVFNDCGEWDYVEGMAEPGGKWVEIPTEGEHSAAFWYRPLDMTHWPWPKQW